MLGSIAVRSFLRYLYAGHLNDRKTEEMTGICALLSRHHWWLPKSRGLA